MEHHGEIPTKNIVAIIPARYSSVRFPGKMLADIGGKPLIVHTIERAAESKLVSRVIVATDNRRIFDAVEAAGHEAVMTAAEHTSGSDRIAEAAEGLPVGSMVVNVQGDEPLISPETIDRAVTAMLEDPAADIVTVSESISTSSELLNGNVVKVVTNYAGRALYFSRSPMPFPRDAVLRYGGDLGAALASEPEILSMFRKHCGLYVYRREYLLGFTRIARTRLEAIEMLEQLRALENGAYIKVVEAAGHSIGVDTEEDLESVRRAMEIYG